MIAEFTEKQPSYRYMPLPNGQADVFIYEYAGERENVYLYKFNTFRTADFTEDEIAENPMQFMNYPEQSATFEEEQIEFNLDCDYRLSCIELGLV